MRILILSLVSLALAATLVGCGGRPSEDELSEALRDEDNAFLSTLGASAGDRASASDEVADCMAGVLHGSELSDEALQRIVDDEFEKPRITGAISAADDGELSDDDLRALAEVLGDLQACAD